MAQETRDGRVQSVWEQRWRERLAAWRQSGLSQQAFCQAHGFSVSSFSHWKSKLARRDGGRGPEAAVEKRAVVEDPAPLRWTEVRVGRSGGEIPLRDRESSGFEIVMARGCSVRLGADFDAEALRRLLVVLEERSC